MIISVLFNYFEKHRFVWMQLYSVTLCYSEMFSVKILLFTVQDNPSVSLASQLGTRFDIFNLTFYRFYFCVESLPQEGGEAPVYVSVLY